MNNHPRIDPAAVVGGTQTSTASLSPAAVPEFVQCPTCGLTAATKTLKTISVNAGSWFGLKQPDQLSLISQHCARVECRNFCAALLDRAAERMQLAVESTPKLSETKR